MKIIKIISVTAIALVIGAYTGSWYQFNTKLADQASDAYDKGFHNGIKTAAKAAYNGGFLKGPITLTGNVNFPTNMTIIVIQSPVSIGVKIDAGSSCNFNGAGIKNFDVMNFDVGLVVDATAISVSK